MPSQSNLNLSSTTSGPVECLGQTFPSEEARREHYLKLLAEKLKDPEFRKIEGFPIGEDEDILALSDPPYYTACPNPWIGDFIQHYGRPYDPAEKYHREPFAADVSEGKNHPIYNAHSYHTKVPHRAIMRYILHYTEPGDIVFDGFCGTGMTGVAAQLCGDRKEVQELGYRVDEKGFVYDESIKAVSKLGARVALLNDLSPAATFIALNYNKSKELLGFEARAREIISKAESDFDWMYTTKSLDGIDGKINYVLWSDVYLCAECAREVVFWDAAVSTETAIVSDVFGCTHCGSEMSKTQSERAQITFLDQSLQKLVKIAKQIPVKIIYTVPGIRNRIEKKPDCFDFELIDRISEKRINSWHPIDELPDGFNTRQPIRSHGLRKVHQFYTTRNLAVLSGIFHECESDILKFLFTGFVGGSTKLNQFHLKNYVFGGGGFNPGPRKGTLYAPSISMEVPPAALMRDRLATQLRAFRSISINDQRRALISTGSCDRLPIGETKNSLDYAFIDPPFGANLNYSELSYIPESWLGVKTNNLLEAIENPIQNKSASDYRSRMASCFSSLYQMLKPGRWVTVEFSNTKSAVWNSIQSALMESGFVVANVSVLDKKQGGINANIGKVAVKQDLVISAYKPDGGLEERFRKTGQTIEGVWDFMRTHLRNLPVVKPRGGELEFIAERDPRILYDRMVAFYVGHGVPVPLSSAEFQAALAEKFPEREGMFFLPEQVTEWDKKRSQMLGVGQMSIFVEDEKSAIDWLRNFLKTRPSVSSDITPEFMQQLGASWKKFETRPELRLLLEQNFLNYDGKGEVPSQIHSYLSSQNKDLRNLPKDDARLQMRAKDRWFVPDPAKAVDVEAVRNKRLVQEFWALCTEAGIARPAGASAQETLPLVIPTTVKKTGRKKLKEVRTEAVRLGFKECFAAKDYRTILAIAAHLPENVIEEDEQLQMMYDMAEMRAQG
jgi:DNA modification methylase